MNDQEAKNSAELHALGLLEGEEKADFERRLTREPALRAAVRDAGDLVASLALTCPQHAPTEANWRAIERRISGRVERGVDAPPSSSKPRPRSLLPWSIAALFALWAGWSTWRTKLAEERILAWPGDPAGAFSSANNTGDMGYSPAAGRKADPGLKPSRTRGSVNGIQTIEAPLVQDIERLKRELAELRAEQANRAPRPGVTDVRLLEMRPPGAKDDSKREGNALLPERMADAIASGLKPKPKEELRLSGKGADAAQDIYIDGGMVNLNALNLHPDAQVIHRNFPKDEEFGRYGLTRVDEDNVWDGEGWLWRRSANGSWIGQRAPDDWTPPDPDGPTPTNPPPLRPAPREESANESREPYALPIIDSSTGKGRLIVQNLPPATDGQVYQLWMIDPRFQSPVSVGLLPSMATPDDHFSFELGSPGVLPAGYLLTLEKAGHVGGPSGNVILQGP